MRSLSPPESGTHRGSPSTPGMGAQLCDGTGGGSECWRGTSAGRGLAAGARRAAVKPCPTKKAIASGLKDHARMPFRSQPRTFRAGCREIFCAGRSSDCLCPAGAGLPPPAHGEVLGRDLAAAGPGGLDLLAESHWLLVDTASHELENAPAILKAKGFVAVGADLGEVRRLLQQVAKCADTIASGPLLGIGEREGTGSRPMRAPAMPPGTVAPGRHGCVSDCSFFDVSVIASPTLRHHAAAHGWRLA